MNLLLTGGTGAIGLEILRQIQAENIDVTVSLLVRNTKKNRKKLRPFEGKVAIFWGDITVPETLVAACKNQDLVFHLAGIIPPEAAQFPDRCRKINVEGTRNLVRALETHAPAAHLIFSSSVVVYGDRLKSPNISVNDPLETAQNDAYGLAKIEAEQLIQQSALRSSIYRLSAIMGIGNHKISGILFNVPLETPMEITTVRDTARAFVHSIAHRDQVAGKVFNLGGGEHCRILYKDFIARAFNAFGMGKPNFPEFAFARQNFHCGYYTDGKNLEDILHFQSDTIDSYFDRLNASVPSIQRLATRPFSGIVKWFLTHLSEPLKAYKSKNPERMAFYFGKIES